MVECRSDLLGNILNLSKHSFSLNTFKLLNKNLNFVLATKQYSQKQLDRDTEIFHLLKLRTHSKDAHETKISDQLYQPFKVKNRKWTSKETHHTLKTFIDLVQHDLNELKTKKVKNHKNNLSNGEQEAMKHLAKRWDLIIITTDKGNAVVIMDTENYIKEANRPLSDKSNYKTLQIEHTLQQNKIVNDILDQYKNENLLSKQTAEGLKVINPKTPKFYIIPKMHKENNPERPVINSINCHTFEISRFVDHHLQPLVKEIPSYIKDTNVFVNRINNFEVPENSFLVTMDVKVLYTNIPNNEGIAAVKRKHDTMKTVTTKVITTFLALILTLNDFIFKSKFYLQINSFAVGTICAP